MAQWFAYSPDHGMSLHDGPDLAKATAQAAIDDYRECCDDGWPEEVERVCWGEVRGEVKEVGSFATGFNYELESI